MIDPDMVHIFEVLNLEQLVNNNPYEIKQVDAKSIVEATYSYWLARIEYRGDDAGPASMLRHIKTPNGYKFVHTYWLLMVKTREYHRGYLLFPSMWEPYDRESGGANPLSSIDLAAWEDPVSKALKSVKFFPVNAKQQPYYWRYQIGFATWKGSAYFEFDSWRVGDASIDKLWQPLFAATEYFFKLYNDPEMNAYFAHLDWIDGRWKELG